MQWHAAYVHVLGEKSKQLYIGLLK
jgi:hypothetical protein